MRREGLFLQEARIPSASDRLAKEMGLISGPIFF